MSQSAMETSETKATNVADASTGKSQKIMDGGNDDSFLKGQAGGGGIVSATCNDPNGLLLSQKPKPKDNNNSNNDTGIYTSLTRLASTLKHNNMQQAQAPLITIETTQSALLIKEYNGHAVALRVPIMSSTAPNSTLPSTDPNEAVTTSLDHNSNQSTS